MNNLGSVTAITDDSGRPVQFYQYDPYGRITNTEMDPVNTLTFVGRYFGQKDWDTGLVYFWHRWYDSSDGRWISRDPIGEKGGNNLYLYLEDNPANYIDTKGLCKDGGKAEEWWHKLVPTHGNYCGPSWSEYQWKTNEQETSFNMAPREGDLLDSCCRDHDVCAYKVRQGKVKMWDCDLALSSCASSAKGAYANAVEIYFGFTGMKGLVKDTFGYLDPAISLIKKVPVYAGMW